MAMGCKMRGNVLPMLSLQRLQLYKGASYIGEPLYGRSHVRIPYILGSPNVGQVLIYWEVLMWEYPIGPKLDFLSHSYYALHRELRAMDCSVMAPYAPIMGWPPN